MEDNIDLFSLPSTSEYKDLVQNNNEEVTNEQLKIENGKLLSEKENLLNEVDFYLRKKKSSEIRNSFI